MMSIVDLESNLWFDTIITLNCLFLEQLMKFHGFKSFLCCHDFRYFTASVT